MGINCPTSGGASTGLEAEQRNLDRGAPAKSRTPRACTQKPRLPRTRCAQTKLRSQLVIPKPPDRARGITVVISHKAQAQSRHGVPGNRSAGHTQAARANQHACVAVCDVGYCTNTGYTGKKRSGSWGGARGFQADPKPRPGKPRVAHGKTRYAQERRGPVLGTEPGVFLRWTPNRGLGNSRIRQDYACCLRRAWH